MSGKVVTLPPSNEQIIDYINAIAQVSSYTYALTKTNLPVISFSPDWYGDFAEKLAAAKAHCLDWMNGIMPNLQELPPSLINLNILIQAGLASVIQNLQVLKADPANTGAKQGIISTIQSLQKGVQSVENLLSGLETGMDEFGDNIGSDYKTLDALAQDAADSAGADKAQIDKLNASIATLQSTIDSKKELVTLEKALALDAIITITAIGIVVGVLTEDPEIIEHAASFGFEKGYGVIVSEGADVKDLQDEIINVQKEMDEVNTSIAVLQSLSLSFQQLEQENADAQKSLSAVKNIWATPANDVVEMMDDLNRVLSDLGASDLDDAIQSAEEVASEWNDIQDLVKLLNSVTYSFDPDVHMIPQKSA